MSKTRGGIAADQLTVRDVFAMFAPEPSGSDIDELMQFDMNRNPHGDSYKPKRRNREEIICCLRYRRADAMLAERERERT